MLIAYTGDKITGYTEALEFSPATPAIPEPPVWGMLLTGFAGLGLLGYRKTRGDNASA